MDEKCAGRREADREEQSTYSETNAGSEKRLVKRVSCVILAAGESKRMGTQKLLLPAHGDIPLIRAITLSALHSSVRDVIVIVNSRFPGTRNALKDLDIEIVDNEMAYKGMSTSFQLGMAALLNREMDGGLFLLGDMPSVQTSWIDKVLSAYMQNPAAVVQACYNSVPGHPVLFDSCVFPHAVEASGDEGGRNLIRHFSSERVLVELDAPYPIDLDTPEEYAAYRKQK
jgi:molybdenum cofactor cytidylyltransferase